MAKDVSEPKGVEKGYAKSLGTLFYVSKVAGIVPFDVFMYQRYKIFVATSTSIIFSLLCVIFFLLYYHYIITRIYFTISGTEASEYFQFYTRKLNLKIPLSIYFVYFLPAKIEDSLTNIIGISIMYLELLTMLADIIASVYHRKLFVSCIDRIERVDEQLHKCHISIDNDHIRRVSRILLVLIHSQVLLMALISTLIFQISSIWWYGIYIPLLLNPISKLWFIVLVDGIRQRFVAINAYLDELRLLIQKEKRVASPPFLANAASLARKQLFRRAAGNVIRNDSRAAFGMASKRREHFASKDFVNRLIAAATDRTAARTDRVQYVQPAISPMMTDNDLDIPQWNKGEPTWTMPTRSSFPLLHTTLAQRTQHSAAIVDDKLDCKLSTLCFLHDDLCDIGKSINQMFSFQMLVLMAYGFMAITAQLYFVYCGLVKQTIPPLFRSAESLVISGLFLFYTASECVYVIYKSWQTKIAAQKTGVYIHKVANVVDENHFYETINHLSLKLLNHHIEFNACGFFDMDMTTIYAISGAITSYLIILIQFNVAAQRTKMSINSTELYDNETMTTPSF